MSIPRCLTIAGSDSGGAAGIQADLKAFAAAGCYGMTAIVALTAQNTVGVDDVLEVPPEFVRAQLEAVFSDIGVDAAKTGMLASAPIVETVADFLAGHPVPLVVDPVIMASSGARLLSPEAEADDRRSRLFPLATVVDPELHGGGGARRAGNTVGARRAARRDGGRRRRSSPAAMARTLSTSCSMGAGTRRSPVEPSRRRRHPRGRLHPFGHARSGLAKGLSLEEAARGRRPRASRAVAQGLTEIGVGEGPVNVLGLAR
jgi:hydroxymethylpyrimidine/phosphomethylpyrimidine kinase